MTDAESSDPFESLRPLLLRKLKGFSQEPHPGPGINMVSYRPDRFDFPVPELVLFTLRDVLGWQWYGAGEKVRWTVCGALDGAPIAFELRKFGFTIMRPEGREDLDGRIRGQLQSALREVEIFLRPLAAKQVGKGEVLIANRFTEFDDRYQFFRELADTSYAEADSPPPRTVIDTQAASPTPLALNDAMQTMNHSLGAKRRGFYYSTAMIESYFSSLEHRLVLLRAFCGRPLAEGDLLKLLAARWDQKLKLVLSMPLSREAEITLGRMRVIKERIRNPFAHGGVENDGGSLFFKLPGIGAVPANFSQFSNSVRFTFLPLEADDHIECCEVFDTLDGLLSTEELAGPDQLLRAGVDPVFDEVTLQEYADVVAGEQAEIEAYIEHWSRAWERHANMDY
jgi:hypothetical protein